MFAFFFYTLLVLFIIVSLFLILLVLIQKGRGGGLASAFGGMGGNTAFGSKTGDVLTWATSIVFGIFLILSVGLNWMASAYHSRNTTIATPVQVSPGAGAVPLGDVEVPAPATQP